MRKVLEVHVIMHTTRATAIEAQNSIVLKANWEQDRAETTDGSITSPDSSSHASMYQSGVTNLQPHTTGTATGPEANLSAVEGDRLVAG